MHLTDTEKSKISEKHRLDGIKILYICTHSKSLDILSFSRYHPSFFAVGSLVVIWFSCEEY